MLRPFNIPLLCMAFFGYLKAKALRWDKITLKERGLLKKKPYKNEKRKTKFKSVFQSNAKRKHEIHIRFSKWCENEKRPIFKVSENEKQKAKFTSVFRCHAKTKNVNGIWIPFSHAIEKRLGLRYTHYLYVCSQLLVGQNATFAVFWFYFCFANSTISPVGIWRLSHEDYWN